MQDNDNYYNNIGQVLWEADAQDYTVLRARCGARTDTKRVLRAQEGRREQRLYRDEGWVTE